jgi:hypothetical protein
MHTSSLPDPAPWQRLHPWLSEDIRGHQTAFALQIYRIRKAGLVIGRERSLHSTRRHIPLPELENPERKQTDEASAILAGYLAPKELAQALGVSERTVAEGIISEKGCRASKSAGRSITAKNP